MSFSADGCYSLSDVVVGRLFANVGCGPLLVAVACCFLWLFC